MYISYCSFLTSDIGIFSWIHYVHPHFKRGQLVEEELCQVTRPGIRDLRRSGSRKRRYATRFTKKRTSRSSVAKRNKQEDAPVAEVPLTGVSAAASRSPSGSLMDLLTAALDVEEAEAARSPNGETFHDEDYEELTYFTPQKKRSSIYAFNMSSGLTPLAQSIHPTFDTPGFDSITTMPFSPQE